MITEKHIVRNETCLEMAANILETLSDQFFQCLVDCLIENNNSILFAEDCRIPSGVQGDEIVVDGLIWNEKDEEVICHYYLLNSPEYENTCNLSETELDLMDVLQAVNDSYRNDRESM